jgi:hypothetical protein
MRIIECDSARSQVDADDARQLRLRARQEPTVIAWRSFITSAFDGKTNVTAMQGPNSRSAVREATCLI